MQRAIPHQPAGPNYQTESEQKNRDCSPQKIIFIVSYQLWVSAKVPFSQEINFLQKICLISTFIANPIPDPLMVGRGDGGLGGHEGDRMNKEEEVVDKSTLTMLMKLF